IRSNSMPLDLSAFFSLSFISFLAGSVGLLFRIAIGFFAFWLLQVEPVHWVWEKLLFTLGGLMLPLAVYPSWLQNIARFTPFPAILGDRSALAIHFSWTHLLSLILLLVFWGLF